jgi:hypothetical protein
MSANEKAAATGAEAKAKIDWPVIAFFALAYAIAWGLILVFNAVAGPAAGVKSMAYGKWPLTTLSRLKSGSGQLIWSPKRTSGSFPKDASPPGSIGWRRPLLSLSRPGPLCWFIKRGPPFSTARLKRPIQCS